MPDDVCDCGHGIADHLWSFAFGARACCLCSCTAWVETPDPEPEEREGDERDQPCRDSGIPGPQQFADWQKLK